MISTSTSSITIVTNNKPRFIIYGFELTQKEKKGFDYYEDDEELDNQTFFRYKGNVYCMEDFMRIDKNSPFDYKKWNGYSSDSFFSGILVKIVDDESVIVGRYYS